MLNRYTFLSVPVLLFYLHSSTVLASDWKKIEDPETLKALYSDTTLRGSDYPPSGVARDQMNTEWQIDYCSDGTGILTFMGHTYPRTWRTNGSDQVCVTVRSEEKCYFFEEHTEYLDVYRLGVLGRKQSKAPWVFNVIRQKPEICE